MSTPLHLSPRTDDGLPCPLCAGVANRVVWHCAAWRVVHADSCAEEDFPAFYRLVSNAHHEEWTDLPEPLRQEGMAILACIETVLRQYLRPRKINLASLGNVVPGYVPSVTQSSRPCSSSSAEKTMRSPRRVNWRGVEG